MIHSMVIIIFYFFCFHFISKLNLQVTSGVTSFKQLLLPPHEEQAFS